MNISRKQKLALNGGEPIFDRTSIPQWPKYSSDIIKSVDSVLKSRTWGIGSDHKVQFEEEFARFQDSKYAVAVANGSIALYIALKACDIKLDDEVIVPAYTFQATAISVLLANAIPVFADIDSSTYNICPESVESLIGNKTKAVIAVHLGGQPANMSKLKEICNRNGLILIEDAAQAHGAEWKGKKVGSIGDAGIFSFQSSKNMTAGEGGIIISNDEKFMDSCFSYYNCGRVRKGGWYEHRHLGGNFRMSAIQAAVLIPQLDSLDDFLEIRESNRKILDSALSSMDGITPLKQYSGVTRSANHLFICRYERECFSGISREIFFKAMQAEGIYTYQGYKPLYKEDLFIIDTKEYPWLKGVDFKNMSFPHTERFSEKESVWLKQNYLLGTPQDTQDIITAFVKVTTEMKKNPNIFLNRQKNS